MHHTKNDIEARDKCIEVNGEAIGDHDFRLLMDRHNQQSLLPSDLTDHASISRHLQFTAPEIFVVNICFRGAFPPSPQRASWFDWTVISLGRAQPEHHFTPQTDLWSPLRLHLRSGHPDQCSAWTTSLASAIEGGKRVIDPQARIRWLWVRKALILNPALIAGLTIEMAVCSPITTNWSSAISRGKEKTIRHRCCRWLVLDEAG